MNFSKIKTYYIYLIFFSLLITGCKKPYTSATAENQDQERSQKLIEMNKALVRKDQLRIKGYIDRNHLEMTETGTGLWYSVLIKGDGTKVKKGNLVNLSYTVSLLDGSECYSSLKNGIKTFVVGQGGVESGLEEGMLLLHAGDKAKFIMPPHLAHGLTGDGNKIPARAIIIYDVELLSIQ